MRPLPTDLLLYELPYYPISAARAEHFESRAKALAFARHIANLYGGTFVAELFPASPGAASASCEGSPYETRRVYPRRR